MAEKCTTVSVPQSVITSATMIKVTMAIFDSIVVAVVVVVAIVLVIVTLAIIT